MKRLSWDEYFMVIAVAASMRSKDKCTQVGACIVDSKNRVLGTGYNGMPSKCVDNDLPTEREGEWLDTKYPYVVHAELNAVLNSNRTNLENSKIYVTLFPCNECAKVILQSGITEVIYLVDKYPDKNIYVAAKRLFDNANIRYRQIETEHKSIVINI